MYGFAASNPALRTRLPKVLAWSLTRSLKCSALVALAAMAASAAGAQTQAAGTIADSQGAPIANARLRSLTGTLLATADSAGHIAYACPATAQVQAASCTVVVEADGFAARQIAWQPGAIITLQPASVAQQVSVTAFRTPIGDLESPANTRTLSNADLRESASITLDGQLREAAGVETFRRSSSLVANPSSQGISLRGLGSTSASRTLVTEDDIPLNDAFAGWIHWEELPELSIRSVELVRGGASDLYGSSAIGGVINVMPFAPTKDEFELKSSYGSENTYQNDLLFSARKGHLGALATGGVLGTDGYILTTPDQRGLIDIPSNVHAQNGLFLVDRQQGNLRVFARTSSMNEARNNGTPVQTNGTRLWRYAVGSDWTPDKDRKSVV